MPNTVTLALTVNGETASFTVPAEEADLAIDILASDAKGSIDDATGRRTPPTDAELASRALTRVCIRLLDMDPEQADGGTPKPGNVRHDRMLKALGFNVRDLQTGEAPGGVDAMARYRALPEADRKDFRDRSQREADAREAAAEEA